MSLNTFMQGAWAILLSRRMCVDDVVFGVTLSSRPAEVAGAETIVGLLINTLPMRVRLVPHIKLLAWLGQIKQQQADLFQYDYSPLARVQEWSGVPPPQPLFERIVRFQNYPLESIASEQHSELTIVDFRAVDIWHYPLCLIITPGTTLTIVMTYQRSRFSAAEIGRMLEQFRAILERMAAQPDQCLEDPVVRRR